MSDESQDLVDEMRERRETGDYERYFLGYCEPRPGEDHGTYFGLKPCPCCGSPADMIASTTTGDVTITCAKDGCKLVEAKTKEEAARIWNEGDFRQRRLTHG